MLKKLPRISLKLKAKNLKQILFFVFFLLLSAFSLQLSVESLFAQELPDSFDPARASFYKTKEIEENDWVAVEKDGRLVLEKLAEKKWVEESTEVYNLTVGGEETYFAGDFAVHNKGTNHYAYFYLDTNRNGLREETEPVTSSQAYTNFFSPCKEEDGPWHSDSFKYKANTSTIEDQYEVDVKASNDAKFGLTLDAAYYGCGGTVYALSQTNRDSPYYPGGVRFKDYDGSPRPVYRYNMAKNDTEDKCSDDSSRLTFQDNYSNDWKPEKDYRGTGSGFELNGRRKYLLQVAEFTVDYTGSYYLKVLDGDGAAEIAPKTRDVNMPVGWIDKNIINWSDYQQDNSYGSYTPTIRQINAYCTSSDCGEGMITDDNKYYNRSKSGTQYELDYYSTTWSGFSDITDAANQTFASFGGTANVKDIMVWSQPDWQCGGECALICSKGHQWLITKDNPPRAFYRSKSCNKSWSSFTDVTSSAEQGFAFLGGLSNVKSRDISCSLNSCLDRVFTHGNQVWQRTASVTGTFGCPTSCGGDCDRCFSWTWGSFSDVTSTYNQALGVVGLTVGDVEDIDRFCVDEPAFSWGWARQYCKDTVIATDGRAFFREYKKLNGWWAIGAGESVCSGGAGSTPPGSCYLEKDKAYLMILSAHTSVRDDCYVYSSSSGFPFLFWRGGQETTGDANGWYRDNYTSAIPIANITPTVSGRVYNDATVPYCTDNTEAGVANATLYLDSWGSNPELTDSLGAFILNNVTVGQHKIYIQPAPDYVVEDCTVTDTTLKYDLVGGSRRYYKTVNVSGSGATANFALVRSGSISGYVYQNSDPTVSCASLGGTGVQGVRVFSTDGSLSTETDSDSNGYFKLMHTIYGEEIPVGTYVLDVDNIPVGMTEDNIKYCPSQSVIMAGDDVVVKIGLLSSVAWWQVTGGDIHADGGGITSTIPHPELCTTPYLMLNDPLSTKPGVASWSSSSVNLGVAVTYPDNVSPGSEDWRAMAGQYQGVEYKYDFWNSHLGSEEGIETFSGGSLPTNLGTTKIYQATGNLDIQGNISADSKVIILHNKESGTRVKVTGDIKVIKGGFLMVITNGNMEVADSVENLQGIFIADGTISFGSADNDTALTVGGSLIGWGNIDLAGRDFGDGRNNTQPVLKFIFRPDLLIEAPEVIRRPQYRWQEIVP